MEFDQGDARAVSLSNRVETAFLRKDSPVGVDRLSVSFDVGDYSDDVSSWDSEKTNRVAGEVAGRTLSAWFPYEGATVYVSVHSSAPGMPVFGKVEFNPSRVVDAGGCSLATPSEAVEALGFVINGVSSFVSPAWFRVGDMSCLRVKRVDVAKDFSGVVSSSSLIRGLAAVPRSWSRKNLVHADPSKNGAQTLMVGSGAGVVRLYDKFAESKGAVEPGLVRWEAECRAGWCQNYGGIVTAEDLTVARLCGLARNRWEWSGMSVGVTSVCGVVDVVSRSGMTKREQASFLGWLIQQGTDNAWEPGSKALAKYRRYVRDLGVTIGPDALSSIDYTARLDWDSGRELVSLGA